jgi:hypothetical protein
MANAEDRFHTPFSLGKGTGSPDLPGEPKAGEPDFLRRWCKFHGIPYAKLQSGESAGS